ncbi:hypothetical protein U9M48_015300 [Paspalum notatum var. saurae]|uniref:Uncharacterized protein n=1 Tax=Paspalum notatum var. saurae TaxID=547442 RepID=A0AAQ3WLU2_PASNO
MSGNDDTSRPSLVLVVCFVQVAVLCGFGRCLLCEVGAAIAMSSATMEFGGHHGIEERTQEQPPIEEPEDPEPYPRQEDLRRAADSAPDDTDPSEEGSGLARETPPAE